MLNIPERCLESLKPIKSFSRYKMCPCHGTIVSYARPNPKVMSPWLDQDGYYRVELQSFGTRFIMLVHRLILETFVGDAPKDKPQVRHLDGNKQNNCLENLCWGDAQENADDREQHGTTNRGEGHHKAKLTKEDVLVIVDRIKAGDSYAEIARDYGMSEFPIACIGKGKSWVSVTGGPLRKPQSTPSGERHGMAKLTEENVNEIRKLLKRGLDQDTIAQKFGVSQSMISMINTKENWVKSKPIIRKSKPSSDQNVT